METRSRFRLQCATSLTVAAKDFKTSESDSPRLLPIATSAHWATWPKHRSTPCALLPKLPESLSTALNTFTSRRGKMKWRIRNSIRTRRMIWCGCSRGQRKRADTYGIPGVTYNCSLWESSRISSLQLPPLTLSLQNLCARGDEDCDWDCTSIRQWNYLQWANRCLRLHLPIRQDLKIASYVPISD